MTDLFAALQSSTRELHEQVEKVACADLIMSQQLSLQEYRALMDKNYSIYLSLEPLLNSSLIKLKATTLQAFASRRLVDIERDRSYVLNPPTPYLRPANIKLPSEAALCGLLYVLEGSRLGGKVIVKALQKNTALAEIPAFHFYRQDAIDIRERWLSFKEAAHNLIQDATQQKAAVDTATAAFRFFYTVYKDAPLGSNSALD